MIEINKMSSLASAGNGSFNQQKGAGMIEVLVALTILAIGLLGVLSLQTQGLQSNQRALFASEANILAFDMADRILAHGISGADLGQYGGLFATAVLVGNAVADNVAVEDQQDWRNAFAATSLPSGSGIVTWDVDADATTNDYTITIRWDVERTGAMGLNCPSTARNPVTNNLIHLTCFALTVTL
jgi:type IV pilus assembly protein PilV